MTMYAVAQWGFITSSFIPTADVFATRAEARARIRELVNASPCRHVADFSIVEVVR